MPAAAFLPAPIATWRTKTAAQVDIVVTPPDELIPVEIKWSDQPRPADARHVEKFIREQYPQLEDADILACIYLRARNEQRNATWDDVMHEICVREAIEKGMADSKAGRAHDVKEVRAKYDRTGGPHRDVSGPRSSPGYGDLQ